MKKEVVFGGVFLFAFLLLGLVGYFCCVATVTPGNVGVIVNLYGQNRGVDDLAVGTGRIFLNPITTQVYEFPTYTQNVVWSKDSKDGDESMTFNSTEGQSVNVDVGLTYTFNHDRVPHIFAALRTDPQHIQDGYLRIKVRDVLSNAASTMKVMEILGIKKQDLLLHAKKELQRKLGEDILIEELAFVGKSRVDPMVEKSISATIQAQQRAIEAQNKVQQIMAEAEQEVAKAEGAAKSRLAAAKAEAESISLKAEAQSTANEKLAKSITPILLQYEFSQKWDGKLPTFMSGDSSPIPFMQVQKQ